MRMKDRIVELVTLFYHWPNSLSFRTYLVMAIEQFLIWLMAYLSPLIELGQESSTKELLVPLLSISLTLTALNLVGSLLFRFTKKIIPFRLIPHLTYLITIWELMYFTTVTKDPQYLYTIPYAIVAGLVFCIGQMIFQIIRLRQLKQSNGLDENENLIDHYLSKLRRDSLYGDKLFQPFTIIAIPLFIIMSIGHTIRRKSYFLIITSSNWSIGLLMGILIPVSLTQAFDFFYQFHVPGYTTKAKGETEDRPR